MTNWSQNPAGYIRLRITTLPSTVGPRVGKPLPTQFKKNRLCRRNVPTNRSLFRRRTGTRRFVHGLTPYRSQASHPPSGKCALQWLKAQLNFRSRANEFRIMPSRKSAAGEAHFGNQNTENSGIDRRGACYCLLASEDPSTSGSQAEAGRCLRRGLYEAGPPGGLEHSADNWRFGDAGRSSKYAACEKPVRHRRTGGDERKSTAYPPKRGEMADTGRNVKRPEMPFYGECRDSIR